MSKITNDGLTPSGTGYILCSWTHVATVGVNFRSFPVTVLTSRLTMPHHSIVVRLRMWSSCVLTICCTNVSATEPGKDQLLGRRYLSDRQVVQ